MILSCRIEQNIGEDIRVVARIGNDPWVRVAFHFQDDVLSLLECRLELAVLDRQSVGLVQRTNAHRSLRADKPTLVYGPRVLA